MGDKSLLSPNYWNNNTQDLFGRYMILNLASIIDWKVIITKKQQKFDIDDASQKLQIS